VNITKQKYSKWRLAILWKFTDKEISEIKINSVSENTKACVKILKQLFTSGSVIIGEYSPRLCLNIVILMSFQTIYSINYGGSEYSRPLLDQNFEKSFITPPPHQYIENFQSIFPHLMPENISVPPLTSSSPTLGIINELSLTPGKMNALAIKPEVY
jgi:hypothetical protein